MIKLLVVDDSALVRKLLGQIFGEEPDFVVQTARSGEEALERLRDFIPDVITLDIHMPGMDGLACLDQIMLERPSPVVMVSTLTAEGAETTVEALRLGAVDFVAKPGGAVSLRIAEMRDEIIAKVRAAAGARLPSTLRLRDRVRHRLGAAPPEDSGAAPASATATAKRSRPAPRAGEGLVVVGVSTGGPPALEAFLQPLPANFPWPIVIAQHMPRSFTGALARRLDSLCDLAVSEVSQPTSLEPGHAYVARGDADVLITRRGSRLTALSAPALSGYPWKPSTDRLVRSAMEHVPAARVVGVLMTGMGDDGAAAMTKLRQDGGQTIAEAEETAVVWGMPGELVKAGGASIVAPLPEIAAHLQALVLRCP